MPASSPLATLDKAHAIVWEAGADHDDTARALAILNALRAACEVAERFAARCVDRKLRAEIEDPQFGVASVIADAAESITTFFSLWEEQREDREQDARDSRAADAADARIAL